MLEQGPPRKPARTRGGRAWRGRRLEARDRGTCSKLHRASRGRRSRRVGAEATRNHTGGASGSVPEGGRPVKPLAATLSKRRAALGSRRAADAAVTDTDGAAYVRRPCD